MPASPQGEAFEELIDKSCSLEEKPLRAVEEGISMGQLHNKKLRDNARTLRKSMTKEERHLWYDFLKDLPIMVHRQKIIGNYIVDFYIAEAKLVIELDGSQHFEEEWQKKDESRDAFLKSQGLTILRYANSHINQNFQGVCQDIWNHIFHRE